MKSRTNFTLLAIVSLVMASCGGGSGGSSGPALDDDASGRGVFVPGGPIVNACSAPYYRDLHGTYAGTVSYNEQPLPSGGFPSPDRDPVSCSYDVTLTLEGTYTVDPVTRTRCETGGLFQAELTGGNNSTRCEALNVAGSVVEPYRGPGGIDLISNPSWPVSISLQLPRTLDADITSDGVSAIYPIGNEGPGHSSIRFTADGSESVVYFPSVEINTSGWQGRFDKLPPRVPQADAGLAR